MTRRQLLAAADSAELSELLAYEQTCGLGDGHFVAGVLAPAFAASMGAKDPSAADYVPYFALDRQSRRRGRRQTGREMRDNFMSFDKARKAAGRV